MARDLNLILIGGIGDSGKSAFADSFAELEGYEIQTLRVSDAIRDVFVQAGVGLPPGAKLGAEVVNEDWKSKAEHNATKLLAQKIHAIRKTACRTVILNSHFATYSTCGFMAGLDPDSLWKICEACGLLLAKEEERPGTAAIVLVDISLSDVLRRRQAVWHRRPSFSLGYALHQDLELNRLYALQYYHTIASFLGSDRVSYSRAALNWPEQDILKPIPRSDSFQLAFEQLRRLLEEKGVIYKDTSTREAG